jgi:hypothetical protein
MPIYSSTIDSDVASVGDSFDKTKFHLHTLNTPNPMRAAGQPFTGHLSGLWVKVTAISGAATLNVRLVADADSDNIIVPDTVATLALGLTTATEGAVTFKIDLAFTHPLDSDNVYVMLETDAGTVTLAESVISYSV